MAEADFTPAPVTNDKFCELVGRDVWPVFHSPRLPEEPAGQLVGYRYTYNGDTTLAYYQKNWYRWAGTHWGQVDEDDVRADLRKTLAMAAVIDKDGNKKPWPVNRSNIGEVIDALKALVNVPSTNAAPCWLTPRNGDPSPARLLFLQNKIVDVDTRATYDPTPRVFNMAAAAYSYDPRATCPTWRKFLTDSFADDPKAVEFLQQWFGYVLSGDTGQQKAALLTGATRSGKGLITRALTALVGEANCASVQLGALAEKFGMEELLGKKLAIVGDARSTSKEAQKAAETLLNITGEDSVGVNRKHIKVQTVKLGARVMVSSNETPRIFDAAGALPGRFVCAHMPISHLGRENPDLERQIQAELPGILNWALDGYDHLRRQGRFTEPDATAEVQDIMKELGSPVAGFVKDCCTVTGDHGDYVRQTDLGAAYRSWCANNGLKASNLTVLRSELKSVAPTVAYRDKPPAGETGTRWYHGVQLTKTADDLRLEGLQS